MSKRLTPLFADKFQGAVFGGHVGHKATVAASCGLEMFQAQNQKVTKVTLPPLSKNSFRYLDLDKQVCYNGF